MRRANLAVAVAVAVAVSLSGAATSAAAPKDRGGTGPAKGPRATATQPATQATGTPLASSSPVRCDPDFDAPAMTLPQWTDAEWGNESSYSTIQAADLDGDGTDELIGRASDGIRAWDFDGAMGQWVPLYPGGNGYFTDDAGWKQPRYYRTIQTGDLDGDGKDEVFGRGVGGVVAYEWAGGSSWTRLPELTALSDDNATSTRVAGPESYYTLQAADVDGDGQDEVIDRWNNSGVNMYKLVDGTWTGIDGIPSWGTTGAYLLPQYYRTLQTADLDGDGSAEAIMMTPDGLDAWEYRGEWSELYNEGADAFEWALLPEFYLTIQAADLDGDGRDEVIGRGPDGIHAYTRTDGWNGTIETGTWKELPALTDSFASGSGWNQAKYYETVQAADVDGDGRQEVLGRGSTGMQVWSLHQSAKKWVELGASGPFTDAQGFDVARSYVPVLAADIDGFAPLGTGASRTGARAEVIGRGPTGVQTWRWNPKGDVWESPSAAFPDYSNGAEAKAYDAIGTALASYAGFTNTGFGEVRDHYGDEDPGDLGDWADQVKGMARPSGVTQAAWATVQSQVVLELELASSAGNGFESLKDLATYLSGDDVNLGQEAVDYLQDYVDRIEEADAELASLLGAFVKAALTMAGPEGSAAGSLISAGITVGMDAATRAEFSGFEGTVDEVIDASQELLEKTRCGLDAARDGTARDYGLLTAVGAFFRTGEWPQPEQEDPTIGAAAALAWSQWVWQQLSNEIGWSLAGCEPGDGTYDDCDWLYAAGADPSSYTIASDPSGTGEEAPYPATQLDSTYREKMFQPVSENCLGAWTITECSLGYDPLEVFLSLDGWAYPCDENLVYDSDQQCARLTQARSEWLE